MIAKTINQINLRMRYFMTELYADELSLLFISVLLYHIITIYNLFFNLVNIIHMVSFDVLIGSIEYRRLGVTEYNTSLINI